MCYHEDVSLIVSLSTMKSTICEFMLSYLKMIISLIGFLYKNIGYNCKLIHF